MLHSAFLTTLLRALALLLLLLGEKLSGSCVFSNKFLLGHLVVHLDLPLDVHELVVGIDIRLRSLRNRKRPAQRVGRRTVVILAVFTHSLALLRHAARALLPPLKSILEELS